MKKKKIKLKALAAASAMVLLMGATAATTWALTNIKMDAGFKIQINGSRNVEATITGASYKNATKVEDMNTIVLDKNSTTPATATFNELIEMNEVSDVVSYNFTVTNNCDDSSYSNLVFKPSVATSDEVLAATTFYVSSDEGATYEVLTDEYITLFTDETIFVKLNIVVPEMLEIIEYTGNITFDLYSEKYAPADYKQDMEYTLVEGIGYKAGKSSLGTVAKTIVMPENDYIVASADSEADNYAQKVFDSDINNKVIFFDEGTYSNVLELIPSAATSKIYKRVVSKTWELGDEVALADIDDSVIYHYTRDFKNVTLVGTENAIFTELIDIESRSSKSEDSGSPVDVKYDAVKDMECSSTSIQYYSRLTIDGLTFQNMNFSGPRGRIFIFATNPNTIFKNISVKDCSFITDEAGKDNRDSSKDGLVSSVWDAAVYVSADPEVITNFVYTNNKVDGHFQGVYTSNIKNGIFANNTISNTQHNAIACQTATQNDSAYYISGKIIVANNNISNIIGDYVEGGNYATDGDRAIRFGRAKDAEISVINNNITNCWVEWMVTGVLGGNSTYEIIDNTYAGEKLENVSGLGNDQNIIMHTPEEELYPCPFC